MTADVPHTYSFTLSLAAPELALATVDIQHHTPAGRAMQQNARKIVWAAAIGGMLLLCLELISIWRADWQWDLSWRGIVGGGLLCFAAFLVYATRPAYARKQALKAATSPALADILRAHTIRLTPEGFFFEGRDSRTFSRWCQYEDAIITTDFILFPMPDRRVNVLPVRVCESRAAAESLTQQCKDWITADGGGAQRCVVTFLEHNDAQCPTCEYQLRNLTRAQCPECGTVLTRENFGQAFTA